jgi:hypothetical protein
MLSGVFFAMSSARAGQSTGDITPDTALDSNTLGKGQGLGFFNDPSFLAVPIPISNPTLGSGAALAGAVLFKTDEQSSSSMIGAAAFRTSNGSWGGGAMGNFAFDEDRYRAKLSLGYASVLYDFYGIGQAAVEKGRFVSITQSGDLVQGLFQTRIAPHFYAGLQARYMNIKSAFGLPNLAGEWRPAVQDRRSAQHRRPGRDLRFPQQGLFAHLRPIDRRRAGFRLAQFHREQRLHPHHRRLQSL